jgi:hypothetical protein
MTSLSKLKKIADENEKIRERLNTDFYLKDVTVKLNNGTFANPFMIVKQFIIDKGLKLYGGQALHMLLKKHKAGFYKSNQLPDYDVFSPDAWNHAKELADLFKKLGFYYIEARASILNDEHHKTFKVAVDTKFVIDITQAGCSKKQYNEKDCKTCGIDSKGNCHMLFDHIPAVNYNSKKDVMTLYRDTHNYDKNVSRYPNKLFICHPEWLLSSMYRELTEPFSQPERLPKVASRLEVFKRFYELKLRTCSTDDYMQNIVPKHKPMLKTIGNFVKKEKLINYGATAFNFFVKGSKDIGGLHISDYKVYVDADTSELLYEEESVLLKLLNLLKKKYPKHKFKIIQKHSYWKEHLDDDIILLVKVGNKYNSLITFTVSEKNCVPYIQYNGVRYVTVDKLKYLYYKALSVPEFYKLVENDQLNYRCLLNNILKSEKKYKTKKRSKFRQFVKKGCKEWRIGKREDKLIAKYNSKIASLKKTKYYKNKPKKGYITKVSPISNDDLYLPYYPINN